MTVIPHIFARELEGRCCDRVQDLGADNWIFRFEEAWINTHGAPWRILIEGRIALGNVDHLQLFGLPKPVDAAAEAMRLLCDDAVSEVLIADGSSDLRVTFQSGAQLDVFNLSSGYEGWQGGTRLGDRRLRLITLGGGGVAFLEEEEV